MMSEVSAISGQATAKPGKGLGKAAGAPAAAGMDSLLDGAFAALLGKAGETGTSGAGGSFASLLTVGGRPGASAASPLDPVQVDAASATEAPVGVCVVEIDGFGQLDEKLGKAIDADGDTDEDGTLPSALLATAQLGLPVQAAPVADDGKPGEQVIEGVASAKIAVVAEVLPTTESPVKVATAAMPAPQAQSAPQTKAVATAGEATAGVALGTRQEEPSTASDDGSAQGNAGEGKGGSQDARAALPSPSRTTDASAAAADTGLRSIVQSLPPVLQSQLQVGAPAAAGPAISTGELLGNQVIDMSVEGQWIDRMAREIATLAEGTGHSRFQLSPPNLGKIQVDLWRSDDRMNLRLLTDTDEAARRLNEGKTALETHARVAALSLGQVSVEKAPASDQARDQGQQQSSRQGAEQSGGQGQQQASAQAQGQNMQGRGNGGPNHGGNSAVIGQERAAEPEQPGRMARANDPHVRFA